MSTDPAMSFGQLAERYAEVRPGYPAEAVDFVLAGMSARTVLDLAAGTGKLTGLLRGRGARVLAIDPDPKMLAQLRLRYPDVAATVASAEQTGLDGASLDALFVGQALHWFSRPQADFELARVLRPGGVAGLLWNFPDTEVGWVARLYDATTGVSPARLPQSSLARGPFDAGEQAWFRAEHRLAGPQTILALVSTWSWVIVQPPAERAQTEQRVRDVIAEFGLHGGPIVMPVMTKVIRQYRC